MSDWKPKINIQNNKIEYNGSFFVDLDRFAQVTEQMFPIYKQYEEEYKKLHLFPEFVFEPYFFKKEYTSFLGDILFLSAYFDTQKLSKTHYTKDMKRIADLFLDDLLLPSIKRNAQSYKADSLYATYFSNYFLNKDVSEEKIPFTKNGSLLPQLYDLSWIEKWSFIKHTAKHIVDEFDLFKHKQREGIKTNNNLVMFNSMLEHMIKHYDGSPLRVFSDVSSKEGYERLLKVPGIGDGLAYLITLFYAHAGLINESVHELTDVPPKIDKNDILLARLTNVLHIKKLQNKTPIIYALAKGMELTAERLGISAVDVDLSWWASSQVYRQNLPIEYSPAKQLFSKEQFFTFTQSDYYQSGMERPDIIKKDNDVQLRLF